jgi:hypothetical protein
VHISDVRYRDHRITWCHDKTTMSIDATPPENSDQLVSDVERHVGDMAPWRKVDAEPS